jgi:hypothetical protein
MYLICSHKEYAVFTFKTVRPSQLNPGSPKNKVQAGVFHFIISVSQEKLQVAILFLSTKRGIIYR